MLPMAHQTRRRWRGGVFALLTPILSPPQLLSRSWPRLADIYVLGAVSVRSFARAGPAFSRLAHLDLFNQVRGG